jgi:hypothetical protein
MLRNGYYAVLEASKANPTSASPTEPPVSPIPGHSSHKAHHHRSSHMEHCFDYLRQALACAADSTLEKRNSTISGVRGWGVTHQCRDYDSLKRWTEENRYNQEAGIVKWYGSMECICFHTFVFLLPYIITKPSVSEKPNLVLTCVECIIRSRCPDPRQCHTYVWYTDAEVHSCPLPYIKPCYIPLGTLATSSCGKFAMQCDPEKRE